MSQQPANSVSPRLATSGALLTWREASELANRACARLISTNDLELKRYKSRIPASLRPTTAQIDLAMESGFDRARVMNMFEHFQNFHIAMGSYAAGWNEMWESWVGKAIDLDFEQDRRDRVRAYFANQG